MMKKLWLFIFLGFFLINSIYAESIPTKDIRIYALNCGYITIHDMAPFSDTNFYPHKEMTLADPCFLIKHPQGWLLWDIGWGSQYEGHATEIKQRNINVNVPTSLQAQLKQLGLKTSDIRFVALSHAHLDHSGDAGDVQLFSNATFLVQKAEYDFTQQKPLQASVKPETFKNLSNSHKQLLNGDYDVFGDGSVMILYTPGHTPGHQSLKVLLPHTGLVILSGDLYHTRQAYQYKLVPTFNTSRAETLASMARIDTILQDKNARLIIQHDPDDFAALPVIPGYLN